MKLPKARTENIVEQNLGIETLIYDLTIHQAFNSDVSKRVVYDTSPFLWRIIVGFGRDVN